MNTRTCLMAERVRGPEIIFSSCRALHELFNSANPPSTQTSCRRMGCHTVETS